MTKLELARSSADLARKRAEHHRRRAEAWRQLVSHSPADRERESAAREDWAEENLLLAEIFEDAIRLYESKEEETI